MSNVHKEYIIPQYIAKTLERRRTLAERLAAVCADLDGYCERIGIDLSSPDNSLLSDAKIYFEPQTAYEQTKEAIMLALGKGVKANEC